MTDLDDLRTLLGAPAYGGATDWNAAARELGAAVPTDFRELLDAFGSGRIGHDTLLLRPFAPDGNFDQIVRHRERLEDLEMIWEDEAELVPDEITKPAEFDQLGVRPMLWAASGLGFYLYWIACDDTAPDLWRIAVEPARGGIWETHPGTATNLLLRLLRGETTTRFLHSLQDAEQHYFTPAG